MEHEIKKNQPYVCPFCGSEESYMEGASLDEYVGGVLISVDRVCETCGRGFTDYYQAKYDGYADSTGFYDKNGEKEGN